MRRPPTNAPGGDLERAEEPDRLRAKSAVDEVRGRMRRVDATAQGYGAEGGLRRNVPRGRPYRSPDGRDPGEARRLSRSEAAQGGQSGDRPWANRVCDSHVHRRQRCYAGITVVRPRALAVLRDMRGLHEARSTRR